MDVTGRSCWNWCRSQLLKFHRSLTRTFDYTTDQFFGLEFLLAAGGVRLNSKYDQYRRCWTVYRWLILVPVLLALWNTSVNVYQHAKLEIILSCLQGTVCGFTTDIRMMLILRNYDSLVNFRKYLNQRYFGRDLEPAWDIRCESFYRNRKTVIFSVGFIIIYSLGFFAQDFANFHLTKFPGEFIRKYPILLSLAEMTFHVLLFGLVLKILCVTLIVPMILNGLKTEIRVIVLVISDSLKNSKKQMSAGNSHQQKNKFWKNLQEDLNECVELHAEFLSALVQIRPLLNATFLVLYYSAAFSLASGAIYVSQMKTVTVYAFQTLFYGFLLAFECHFVAKIVDDLADICESISTEIYELDWPTKLESDVRFRVQYRSIRTTMVTLMAVAQQPLRLNSFGPNEFNQEQFYELLNTTYSLYTFFRGFV